MPIYNREQAKRKDDLLQKLDAMTFEEEEKDPYIGFRGRGATGAWKEYSPLTKKSGPFQKQLREIVSRKGPGRQYTGYRGY
jgi:hypothetical protein